MLVGQRDFEINDQRKLELTLETDVRKAYRMYKTILEIMDYRQYIVNEESKNMTLPEFNDLYQRGDLADKREIFPPLDMGDEEEQDPSIAVFYNFAEEELSPEYVNRVIKSCGKITRFFLVSPSENKKGAPYVIDKKTQNFINELSKKDPKDPQAYRFEIFKQEELLFNVLKHDLVPEHRVLSEPHKVELLHKYKVKESQLPKILLGDPVSRFLGLRRGQVVKITRKSETAGTYTTYRIAI